MNAAYENHCAQRAAQNIPPLPLTAEQMTGLAALLRDPACAEKPALADLLIHRVSPGVDPAAKVKADFLSDIAHGRTTSPLVSPKEAVRLLGTMMGGYNVPHLIDLLDHATLAADAAQALKGMVLIFAAINDVDAKCKAGNVHAQAVMQSWADAEWFTTREPLPETIHVTVFRVDGEVNTDDFSPAKHASTRPDIPLHALSMGETRFPGGIETLAAMRAQGKDIVFVADTVGTGSSRKSATNSLIWHIGADIPFVPNKRRGGVVMGSQIAPIFFNTFEDAGGLPIRCDVSSLKTGDTIIINTTSGTVTREDGSEVTTFQITPQTLPDEFRAGGRVPLIIGRKLTAAARERLELAPSRVFITAPVTPHPKGQGYTLAQKLVGKACGCAGVLPDETCEPFTTTVGSQDTTGPMTRDELTELACLKFSAPMVMQSFCHTAAYPKEKDKQTHATLPTFISERGGVALRPGDGIIHSWLNRLLVPDTVGTGGDSHTRFPLGISFPAGSGLVAFAAALGCMPLDMPESVLVKFTGALPAGITLRDAVNAIALVGIEKGLVDRPGKGSKNIFNSRILEMEGLPDLSVEQAFELTCATAERSASAGTIALSEEAVITYLRENVALMKDMVAKEYASSETLQARIAAVEAWLKNPVLMRRDAHAEFAATVEVNLSEITEPICACPNNPDAVDRLSTIAGTSVDEVFIGSCMTNIAQFRAAAKVLAKAGGKVAVKRLWITPPTRMDRDALESEGVLEIFRQAGARIEIPGCSLCMGNQARVDDNVTVFATSTRNFDNRMGDGAQVFLGSALLAAVTATLGKLPTVAEYFAAVE